MLLDRLTERAAISGLLAAARSGRSAVLVVHGEAGVGKTALLEDAIASAAGLRIARVAGIESEMERTGDRAAAAEALKDLTMTTGPSGTDWAAGTEAQCRALLSDGDTADELYREAITKLQSSRVRLALARAHLLYGEWLRRDHRHLAARELRATGATVRKPTAGSTDGLTPQETQVARLASEGLSNSEIGSRLFLSARTVEYHLRKVFTKLRINSRKELMSVLDRTLAFRMSVPPPQSLVGARATKASPPPQEQRG
jgi:DNA-binding NarL/FixJ family response regulator